MIYFNHRDSSITLDEHETGTFSFKIDRIYEKYNAYFEIFKDGVPFMTKEINVLDGKVVVILLKEYELPVGEYYYNLKVDGKGLEKMLIFNKKFTVKERRN